MPVYNVLLNLQVETEDASEAVEVAEAFIDAACYSDAAFLRDGDQLSISSISWTND